MKIFFSVIKIIVSIILLVVVFIGGVIFVDFVMHPNEIPSFFGWKPFIVMTDSMKDEIMAGDLVLVKEIDTKELKKNDIIAYKTNDDIVINHRIVDMYEVKDNGLVYETKGDNLEESDEGYVKQEQVEGLFQYKIGGLGSAALFISSPKGMVICLIVPLVLLICWDIYDDNRDKIKFGKKQETSKS